MKKMSVRVLILLVLAGLLAVPAFAGPVTLVGSWSASATDDNTGEEFRTLWTFNVDRTLTVSGDLDNASTGHGAWKRMGRRTFEAVNTVFLFGPDGTLAFLLKNRATFEVSSDGDSFTAVAESDLTLPDGTVIDSSSNVANGTRIKVD